MLRIFLSFLFLMIAHFLPAQTYDQLWKQLEQANKKDLPQTALRQVRTLKQKAQQEKQMAQWLRALSVEASVCHEISPDSASLVIESWQHYIDQEARPLPRALAQHLLALWLYEHARYTDTTSLHCADLLLIASLNDLPLLAKSSTREYLPLFRLGKSSREAYADDLLNLMLEPIYKLKPETQRQLLRSAMELYEQLQRPQSTLQVGLRLAEVLPAAEREAHLEELRQKHLALPQNAETYYQLATIDNAPHRIYLVKEGLQRYGLQNAPKLYNLVQQMEAPSLFLNWEHPEFSIQDNAFYPGLSYWAKIAYNNVRKVELRLLRLQNVRGKDARLYDAQGDLLHREAELSQLLRSLPSQEEARYSKVLPEVPAHERHEDSLACVFPQSGVYVVELQADGKTVDRAIVFATKAVALKMVARSAQEKVQREHWVDALTGNPKVEAEERDYLPKQNHGLPYFGRLSLPSKKAYRRAALFADRAIYRPGQTVRLSGLIMEQQGDNLRALKGTKAPLTIVRPDGEGCDTLQVCSDEWGGVTAEYVLPTEGKLGDYYFKLLDATLSVKVEEYKRPTFSVELDPLPKSFQKSDTIQVIGRVATYNGVPLVGINLRWKAKPNSWWRFDEEEDNDQEGEVNTDEQGRFSFACLPPQEGRRRYYYGLSIEVEAMADNGETQMSSLHHYFHARPEMDKDPETLTLTQNKDKSQAIVKVNTPCFLFVDVLSDKGGHEKSQVIEVSDSLSLNYAWTPEMGDAAMILAAYVKNGRLVQVEGYVQRPIPDKRLLLQWSTFRSELQPGQQEQWTLKVTHPDGRPATARLMARLYDASLDAFAQSKWRLDHQFARHIPRGMWEMKHTYAPRLDFAITPKSLPEKQWNWTRWRNYTWDGTSRRPHYLGVPASLATMKLRSASLFSLDDEAEMAEIDAVAEVQETPSVPLRQNFQETGFFYPQLFTNAQGEATLRFTLPESLTAWSFSALATDTALNCGWIEERIVARKQLSAESFPPRFVREGDFLVLPCRLRNLSDAPQSGQVKLQLVETTTGKVLKKEQRRFSLEPGASETFEMDYQVLDGQEELLLRIEAKSPNYADGEERRWPVLSRFVTITHAQPFIVKIGESYEQKEKAARQQLMAQLEKGVKPNIDADTCKDAREEVRKMLPQLLEQQGGSVLDVATRLYSIELVRLLQTPLAQSPEQLAAMARKTENQLAEMQLDNGAWTWYKGMRPSVWMTADVVQLLSRLRQLTKKENYDYLIARALRYLDAQALKDVEEMKKQRYEPYLFEWHYRYLYAHRQMGNRPSAAQSYLIDLIPQHRKDLSMYGKSGVAVILAGTSYEAESRLALESLVEHTVRSEEMGRYFDTNRAFNGRSSYRIPTQTFAIEALQLLKEKNENVAGENVEQLIDELRLWLLQSKRAQVWNTSRATSEAVYAILSNPNSQTDGLTWGALSATYRLPAVEAIAKGQDLQLERRLQRFENNEWRDIEPQEQLILGQKVRWGYALTAQRDFDHVALRSTRPACFETLQPLSGYSWNRGIEYYRMSRDTENEYFIEHLSKGHHLFTDEMRVVKTGNYDAGIALLQSVFAPEFRANSQPLQVKVKR